MQLINQNFEVQNFNIDGVTDVVTSNHVLIKVSNPVNYGIQWQLVKGVPLGFLLLEATYNLTSKVNLEVIATYKTLGKYTFSLNTFDNEAEEILKLVKLNYAKMAENYNLRIAGTKLKVPYPNAQEDHDKEVKKQIIFSLHEILKKI